MSSHRFAPWFAAVGLVLASGMVVGLSIRLRALSRAYQELQLRSTLPHAGLVVPTFQTVTLGGDSITVGETADSSERQVLFVFNTTCPYCRGLIPVWQRLADSLVGLARPVQVLAISLDPPDTTGVYVGQHGIRYPVVTFPQRKLARLYRAAAVPQTVVLDPAGRVLYAKTGILEAAHRDSVYRAVLGWGAAFQVRRDTTGDDSEASASAGALWLDTLNRR